MSTNLTDLLLTRYTTKAFDPSRRLSAEQLQHIESLLRMSPSSTNLLKVRLTVSSFMPK